MRARPLPALMLLLLAGACARHSPPAALPAPAATILAAAQPGPATPAEGAGPRSLELTGRFSF